MIFNFKAASHITFKSKSMGTKYVLSRFVGNILRQIVVLLVYVFVCSGRPKFSIGMGQESWMFRYGFNFTYDYNNIALTFTKVI
jgi:hypothetical protein